LALSRAGDASKAQKQIRMEMVPAGAEWWTARSARAAMMALYLSGMVFRRQALEAPEVAATSGTQAMAGAAARPRRRSACR
jgi:hypothetical protein